MATLGMLVTSLSSLTELFVVAVPLVAWKPKHLARQLSDVPVGRLPKRIQVKEFELA
tara:strand:- start:1368 stop:1538 length:171 start_codon:yes stop_codon:yes gene_type:complete